MEVRVPMELVITIILTFVSSSGFWVYVNKRMVDRSAFTKLLMGLAYDKITHLGMKYIERGWISKDEYEDFQKYFYEPYKQYGGNGVAERIMRDVSALPFRNNNMMYAEIDKAKIKGRENLNDS